MVGYERWLTGFAACADLLEKGLEKGFFREDIPLACVGARS